MSVSLRQSLRIGSYLMRQKLTGTKKFPLLVELEPLFACNLKCAGCGKIQQPHTLLKQRMPVEQALAAIEECGAPMVSIAGGEPLMHPQIDVLVNELIKRKKFVFLCTNALLLPKKIEKFKPSPYFAWVVHIDGLQERHDESVCKEGVFDDAVAAIKDAKQRGFKVNTNTTVFNTDTPQTVIDVLNYLNDDLGIDEMQISPAYAYEKAPDQEHFLGVTETRELFRKAFDNGNRKRWRLNHTPLFLDFLEGKADFGCTAWGIPSYSLLGWQKPCYLMSDGYVKTYKELIETTDWDSYGRGKDPRCANCMAHCGYEPSAVLATMGSLRETIRAGRGMRNTAAVQRAARALLRSRLSLFSPVVSPKRQVSAKAAPRAHIWCGNSGNSGRLRVGDARRCFGEDSELSAPRARHHRRAGGTGRRGDAQRDRPDPGPAWLPLVPALVTLLVGLYKITGPSFTRDESATLAAVHRSFPQLVSMLGHVDVVHGAYYALIWVVVRIGGSGEFALRLPSAIAMAVAAAMVTLLGRRLVSCLGRAGRRTDLRVPAPGQLVRRERPGRGGADGARLRGQLLPAPRAHRRCRPGPLAGGLRRDAGGPRPRQPLRPAPRGRPRGHAGLVPPRVPGRPGLRAALGRGGRRRLDPGQPGGGGRLQPAAPDPLDQAAHRVFPAQRGAAGR